MKKVKLYSRNQEVFNKAVKCLIEKPIIRFESQSQLYRFIEDIKNPWIKTSVYRNNRSLGYMPVNYEPIVLKLMEFGIISKDINTNSNGINTKIKYNVNREILQNTLVVQ